jgi:hypothetical protein
MVDLETTEYMLTFQNQIESILIQFHIFNIFQIILKY